MSLSWRFIDYLKDVTYCWGLGVRVRLDRSDVITLIIWFSIFITVFVFSIMMHCLLVIIYIASILTMWRLTKRFRVNNALKSHTDNVIEIMKYDICDMNDVHVTVGQWIGRRNHMEDEFFICPKQKLFGVFDGHSGSDASIWIKHYFSEQYEEIFNNLLFKIEKI